MSSVLFGFLSGIFAAVLAWFAGERQVRLRNVTEERAKWREKIREHAATLAGTSEEQTDARRQAALGLKLRLNPYDDLDREIVVILDQIEVGGAGTSDLRGLSLRLQLLLKHDWERAKREANWVSGPAGLIRKLLHLPVRPAKPEYRTFKAWRDRNPIVLDPDLPES